MNVPVPRADVEVDFDLEWDADNRCYLWGFLLHDGHQPPALHSLVVWDPMDEAAEARLAAEATCWLLSVQDAAAAGGRSFLVFHFGDAERRRPQLVLGRAPGRQRVAGRLAALADRHFVDLRACLPEHPAAAGGGGLKSVAAALGFRWRDPEAGGRQSRQWRRQAHTDPAARQRLLDYNEDDLRATWLLRRRLTAWQAQEAAWRAMETSSAG